MTLSFDKVLIVVDCILNDDIENLKTEVSTLQRDEINKLSPHGITPLHYACIEEDLDMVECLLEHTADPSLQDIDGWTPLHIAAATNNHQLAVRLLAEGADPCLLNNDQETASDVAEEEEIHSLLHAAEEKRRREEEAEAALREGEGEGEGEGETEDEEESLLTALKQALTHKQNVSEWEEMLGISEDASILHLAVAYGYSRLVKYICEEGVVSVNTRDSDGWTPLHVASYWQESEIEGLLLSHGANPLLTTKHYYNTPSDLQNLQIHN